MSKREREPSNQLHQLIHSLTRGERQNFKVRANKTGSKKKYLTIFDAILRMENYDEEKLMRKFKGESFIKSFSSFKYYLYKIILDSLVDSDQAESTELNTLSQKIRILSNKGLYAHLNLLLKRAKKLAGEQENFSVLLKLLNLERNALKFSRERKQLSERLNAIWKTELEVEEKMINLRRYVHLRDEIMIHLRDRISQSTAQRKQFLDYLASHPLMQGLEQAKSVRTQIIWWIIRQDQNRLERKFEACIQCTAEILSIIEANQVLLEDQDILMTYIRAINNAGSFSLILGKFDKVIECATQMQEVDTDSLPARAMLFELHAVLMLTYALKTVKPALGLKLVPAVEEGFAEFESFLDKTREVAICHSITRLYLSQGDISQALTWNNRILNQVKDSESVVYHASARIINLAIHFELGNLELIPYQLTNYERYMKQRKCLSAYEKHCLKLFAQLAKTDFRAEHLKIIQHYRSEWDTLTSQPEMRQGGRSLFDLGEWLDFQLQRLSKHIVRLA